MMGVRIALGQRTDALRAIGRDLVKSIRANVAIHWTLGENGRAFVRVLVKRILRKSGYPLYREEKATGGCQDSCRMKLHDHAAFALEAAGSGLRVTAAIGVQSRAPLAKRSGWRRRAAA